MGEKVMISADPPGGDQPAAGASTAAADLSNTPAFDPEPEPKPEPIGEPGTEPTGDPIGEPTGEPATEAEAEMFDSEGALLEARGVKGHDSIDGYVKAQQSEFEELQSVLQSIGMDSRATNLAELKDEILQAALNARQGTVEEATAAAAETKPMPLDSFFSKYGSQIEDGNKGFYSDYAGAIGGQVRSGLESSLKDAKSPLGQMNQRLSESETTADVALDLMWYNEAKAGAGDDPIPSFAQAQALLKNNAALRGNAKAMLTRFGNTGHNPMSKVFDTWRASKLPGGVTTGQKAKADAAVKKVGIHKGLLKATPATRAAAKPFDRMTPEERMKELESTPA